MAKRDKDGDENDVFAEKTAFLQFFKKKILEKKTFIYIGSMKKLLLSLTLLFFICGCGSDTADNTSTKQAVECNCDCDKAGSTPEIKKDESKLGKLLADGGKVLGGAAAGALLAKKLQCERFDIEVEYLMLDACLNSCSGVADKASRISKCARAIQDMECSEGLSRGEINQRVNNSCPLQ